ncbi:exodeoxyribonuclease VII small subunit [Caldalkalibacillus uzonensis]|uniref:Exodeoxyribonuclease 7 small subunit n=1 Tax=Caldalkalibacillus uzonensis TaxID=353224 RepID=A0ABU0CMT5_9BACI|nr:exodeoxyribonuclease VII small subunit [Caldalkalibacillus uzonensis]MDQ0337724.1 exodeoxyribonuclease VII small subunit [Caldalkalibacillus uzonensis]
MSDTQQHDKLQEKTEEETLSFEEAIGQLETIVEQLESGDVPLEQAIQLFQKGMRLSNVCHDKLKKVEQQVNILLEEEGQLVEKAFQIEEESE